MIRKIFAHTPKVVNKVVINVADTIVSKELHQAKGVMQNYLRDKKFFVGITDSFVNSSSIDIRAISDNKKLGRVITIEKVGEESLLRRVYRALETLAKDSSINPKRT